ncbi:hypothetical protein JCM3770_007085 [Rhodotorula araucariae]
MAVSATRASSRSVSHLLLAGLNPLSPPASASHSAGPVRQNPSNPTLAPVPFHGWLASVGREIDTTAPLRLRPASVSAGAGHQLVAYRNYEGVDRVFALGRNEAGQLGVGFASQEGTRALVEGFDGDEVLAVRAGVQASYVLVRDRDSTRLFSMGNLARGRLGHPALFPPADPSEDHQEPRQYTLPYASVVPLPEGVGPIKQIEAGFEHLLVLTETGELYGTGCNTDGQLGLGNAAADVYQLTRVPLPSEVDMEGGVERISAGADTSALVTRSGSVWTWGNSEYAQGMHGEKIDQIASPLRVNTAPFLPSNRRVVDYRCGGSFALALDDHGSVYSAGYGALGLGAPASATTTPSTTTPARIERLEGAGVKRIRAGWGYGAAVRDQGNESALWTWGLNTAHGRLGLGLGPGLDARGVVQRPAHEPCEVRLPVRELGLEDAAGAAGEGATWAIGEVECGMESMWVEVTVDEELR